MQADLKDDISMGRFTSELHHADAYRRLTGTGPRRSLCNVTACNVTGV
jgi:hypothetical protein